MTKQEGLKEDKGGNPPPPLQRIRHGLVDGLDPITHCELVHYFLRHVVEVDLPSIVAASVRDLHRSLTEHVCGVVEEVLRKRKVFGIFTAFRTQTPSPKHLVLGKLSSLINVSTKTSEQSDYACKRDPE